MPDTITVDEDLMARLDSLADQVRSSMARNRELRAIVEAQAASQATTIELCQRLSNELQAVEGLISGKSSLSSITKLIAQPQRLKGLQAALADLMTLYPPTLPTVK